MFAELTSTRLRLGLAMVAPASWSHASSVIDPQPVGQVPPFSRLETLLLNGGPQEGVIGVAGDRDYFRIDVTGPTLAAIYTSGAVDTIGWLYDPDGRELTSDDDGGEGANFRIDAILPRRGTYYLRVESHSGFLSGLRTGAYSIRAERLEPSQPLSLGGPPQEGEISTDVEADFFRMAVAGPTTVSVYTSGEFDALGTLLDPDGREIATDDDGGAGANFRIDKILPRGGTYYLRVEGAGFFSTSTGSYTLHAERRESPQALALGGTPSEGVISTNDKMNFYRMAVAEPTAVVLHTTGGVDTGAELYDSDGELIAWDDDGGEGLNFRIDTILFRRGTYLLRIVSSHPGFTGSYTFYATAEP